MLATCELLALMYVSCQQGRSLSGSCWQHGTGSRAAGAAPRDGAAVVPARRPEAGDYLAPDPEQKQSGGHAYKVDGSLGANHAAKHVHERKDWPSDKAKKQSGSGRGRGDSDYSRFIRAEMKRNGGKMAMAAKAWREHKQSGGHFARKDGTVSDAERKKYKHTHDGPNPSDTARKAPTSAAAKAADPKAVAKQARADRAAASVVAKASATPTVAPKAPARKASATPVWHASLLAWLLVYFFTSSGP